MDESTVIFSNHFFYFWRRCAARRQKSKKMPSFNLAFFFDFWRRCAARRQKSKKMASFIFSSILEGKMYMAVYILFFREKPTHATIFFDLSFEYNKRHSCRRFPHVRKKITPKKNRGAIFFGVIHCASQLAWTNRP